VSNFYCCLIAEMGDRDNGGVERCADVLEDESRRGLRTGANA